MMTPAISPPEKSELGPDNFEPAPHSPAPGKECPRRPSGSGAARAVCLRTARGGGGRGSRNPGSAYIQLGGTTLGYDRIYNDASEKAPAGGTVRDNVAQLFADVGVLPGFTVTAMAPLVSITFEPDAGGDLSNSGFGDLELGARYTFLERYGYAVAAALDLRLPTGDSEDPNGLLTGDGEVTAVPGILAGRSFHPLPLYVTAGFGYGLRGGRYSDDLRYSFEAGYGLWESTVTVILLFSGQTPLDQKPTVPSKRQWTTPAASIAIDEQNSPAP